ncbi:MAG: HEAT repeat domain-containing protein [Chlamydiales bacterium]|nr:HEAT repeat domain-containing protein [Chlamydiales bacterium]
MSAALCASALDVHRRIQCHLLIGDVTSAIEECRAGLVLYPNDKPLQRLLVQSLAKRGFEKDALKAWHVVAGQLKGEEKRAVLETLAWGVLSRAGNSNQFVVQYSSLMGARLARDALAVEVIKNGLKSDSTLLRALSVKLACEFRDAPLMDQIAYMFENERHFYVRLEVLRAIGALGLTELTEPLKQIVASERTMAEEKACAIESLVNLYESVSDSELEGFIGANRAGLRAIAPQIVVHLDLQNQLPRLLPLLKDSSSMVRILTLRAFSYLQGSKAPYRAHLLPLMDDEDPMVAIVAAWVGLTMDPVSAEAHLARLCNHESEEVRRIAVGALAAGGESGKNLCLHLAKSHSDPFVKVNAALGLILKQFHVSRGCKTLQRFIAQHADKIMWDQAGLFRIIAPSQVRHIPQIPSYPDHVDQLTRLEVLSILAAFDYKKAKSSIESFLQKGEWGVTHAACAALLGEGATDALDIVKGLLDSKDPKVRVQAALVLAFMGREKSAATVLEDAYSNVPRECKLTILEALGAIGSEESLPFLVRTLDEPFQITRVVAASSIIQCLYH